MRLISETHTYYAPISTQTENLVERVEFVLELEIFGRRIRLWTERFDRPKRRG